MGKLATVYLTGKLIVAIIAVFIVAVIGGNASTAHAQVSHHSSHVALSGVANGGTMASDVTTVKLPANGAINAVYIPDVATLTCTQDDNGIISDCASYCVMPAIEDDTSTENGIKLCVNGCDIALHVAIVTGLDMVYASTPDNGHAPYYRVYRGTSCDGYGNISMLAGIGG